MIKMKTGVVVMTLTATVYVEKIRRTYSSRIGFSGEFNKEMLSEMGKYFKKRYAEEVEAEYKDVPVKPSKCVCRVSIKATECDMILNGK